MKKIILSVCAVSMVTLAAINVNIATKTDSAVNLTMASIFSLAKGEDSGSGGCPQYVHGETIYYPNGSKASICTGLRCGSGDGICPYFLAWTSFDENGTVVDNLYESYNHPC